MWGFGLGLFLACLFCTGNLWNSQVLKRRWNVPVCSPRGRKVGNAHWVAVWLFHGLRGLGSNS